MGVPIIVTCYVHKPAQKEADFCFQTVLAGVSLGGGHAQVC